eukprot:CAMPEP_0182876958 /NCGR_PEP_ID=MMETSP0034_2-20130328/14460_1 /TAXON_ID=156128 /ORGANISM="Nephroselmis pyriformis, Strain CCMP717" /LENGTH=383 /DNA_ID=CAMNT_0025009773 /DNA_START=38 /DNA_END=1186 /DNA_ORIENTATION=+
MTKGGRSATASTVVLVEKGSPPAVTIEPLASDLVNADERLVLRGTVQSAKPASLSINWVASGLDLEDPAVVPIAGGAGMPDLLVAAGSLSPGSSYVFTLRARDDNGEGFAAVAIETNMYPLGGSVAASPKEGRGLATKFSLQTNHSAWEDLDRPLSYLWTYRVVGATGQGAWGQLTSNFSPSPGVEAYLPGGLPEHGNEVKVQVYAKDARGATTPSPVEFPVTVQGGGIGETEEEADAFIGGVIEAARLEMDDVNIDNCLQLTQGLAGVLNGDAAARRRRGIAASRGARQNQRRELIGIVTSASADVRPTATALTRMAGALGDVVAEPLELSPASQDEAIGFLGTIVGRATEGSASPSSLDQGVAGAVLSSLDSVSEAAAADN